MIFRQSTFGEIIESERRMLLTGEERYGSFFINARDLNSLLMNFTKTVDLKSWKFMDFFSHFRKYHTLALFSALRLHSPQAQMNMRQVLEAGTIAAYFLENPEYEKEMPKKLKEKSYKWIEKEYQSHSKRIKELKDTINNIGAHANPTSTSKTCRFDKEMKTFITPFFDTEVEHHVQAELWMIGHIAIGFLNLFHEMNMRYGGVKFSDDFMPQFIELSKKNKELKEKLKSHSQISRFD